MRKKIKSNQSLSPQEQNAIEDYLSKSYPWEVVFSRHIVMSRSAEILKNSVVLKSGDVVSLQGDVVYYKPRNAEREALKAVPESSGLFVVKEKEDDKAVHLELVRVTDFASACVPA